MRHDIFGILLSFGRMTRLAVIGADHHMNIIAVVIKCILVRFGPLGVAFGTTDHDILQTFRNRFAGNFAGNAFNRHGVLGSDPRVTTVLPVFHDTRMN